MLRVSVETLKSAALGAKINLGAVFNLGGKILDPVSSIGGANGRYADMAVTGLLTAKEGLNFLGQVQAGRYAAGSVSVNSTVSEHVEFAKDYAISGGLAAASAFLPGKFKIAARLAALAWSAKTAAHSRLLEAAEETRPGDPLRETNIAGRALFNSYVPGVGLFKNFFLADKLGLREFAKKDQELGLVSKEKLYLGQPYRDAEFIDQYGVGENPFEWLLHLGKPTSLDESA